MANTPEFEESLDTDAILDTVVACALRHRIITIADGDLLLNAYSLTRSHCDFDSAAKRAGISLEAALQAMRSSPPTTHHSHPYRTQLH